MSEIMTWSTRRVKTVPLELHQKKKKGAKFEKQGSLKGRLLTSLGWTFVVVAAAAAEPHQRLLQLWDPVQHLEQPPVYPR